VTAIFVATLGQRPEAITVALDLLMERYHFSRAVIVHTEPRTSGIAGAYSKLAAAFPQYFANLEVRWSEILGPNGEPFVDINNQAAATAYFRGIYSLLRTLQADGEEIHLLVAGGRKAMSIYAALAAGLVFGPRDRVWTVLSPPGLVEQAGQFIIPPGMRHEVQVVALPVLPLRIPPDQKAFLLPDDPIEMVDRRMDARSAFLKLLTEQEQLLIDLLDAHPTASNKELARLLNKSYRTIDHQFRSIYAKMVGFVEFGEQMPHKRRLLMEILRGEV